VSTPHNVIRFWSIRFFFFVLTRIATKLVRCTAMKSTSNHVKYSQYFLLWMYLIYRTIFLKPLYCLYFFLSFKHTFDNPHYRPCITVREKSWCKNSAVKNIKQTVNKLLENETWNSQLSRLINCDFSQTLYEHTLWSISVICIQKEKKNHFKNTCFILQMFTS